MARGEESEFLQEDGLFVEAKKVGTNSRRIRAKIAIAASLDDVWRVLTDYERMAEVLPSLAVSKLVDKQENFARIFQIGQQNLPFGMKFKVEMTVDYYERDLEVFGSGKRRDIEFKSTDGHFEIYEGKWSIEQLNKQIAEDDDDEGYETTLSYVMDIKPKIWVPVMLVEGRFLKEIKTGLSCLRDEVNKMIQNARHSR